MIVGAPRIDRYAREWGEFALPSKMPTFENTHISTARVGLLYMKLAGRKSNLLGVVGAEDEHKSAGKPYFQTSRAHRLQDREGTNDV